MPLIHAKCCLTYIPTYRLPASRQILDLPPLDVARVVDLGSHCHWCSWRARTKALGWPGPLQNAHRMRRALMSSGSGQ